MKHILSLLFLAILLISAMCSCRASKHATLDYSDTASVSVVGLSTSLSTEDILSFFFATREVDLAGVKLEFFPPDSAHPDARAAPKSLTVESVKAKESAEQAAHITAAVDEQKTVNLSAQQSSTLQQDTRHEADMLRPSDRVIFLSLACALIILFLIYFFKKK